MTNLILNMQFLPLRKAKIFLDTSCYESLGISGSIADLLAYRDKRLIQSLLSLAIEYFKLKKINWITFDVLPDSLLYKVLRENGFTLVQSESSLIAKVNSERISDAFVRDVRHWHVTAGDTVNRVA